MPKKAIVLLVLMAFVLGACGGSDGTVGLDATDVTFDVSFIEIKGSTDGIDPPSVDPAGLSDGYRFKPPGEVDPDNAAKWQVSTYMISPAALTIGQGDSVTLRTFVINGDEHTVWVQAPDGSTAAAEVTMNRGREYEVKFTADQAGYYSLLCDEHSPTMSAQILSLPTG